MNDDFKIYIDRLKNGHEAVYQGDFSPDFLEVEEEELQFTHPITVNGSAYIANDQLVINMSIKTNAKMPCIICNQMADIPIFVKSVYHNQELSKIKAAIFDFSYLVRESILLEVPKFNECNQQNCPERKNINSYLKKDVKDQHFPFQELQS